MEYWTNLTHKVDPESESEPDSEGESGDSDDSDDSEDKNAPKEKKELNPGHPGDMVQGEELLDIKLLY